MLLGVVADVDLVAPRQGAAVGLGRAGEDAEQAGLARPVEPEHEQPLAPPDLEVQVVEHGGPVAVALGEVGGRSSAVRPDGGGSGRCRRRPRRAVGASTPSERMRSMRVSSDLANAALLALAPHRSTRVWRRAISVCCRRCDLGQPDLVALAGRLVLRVGALVVGDLADVGLAGAVEVQDPGDRLVEQLEVVADDDQGAAVGAEEVEQPVAGVVVEVVRRLVEHEQLAAGEQDAGQLDPPALAARQHGDRHVRPGRRTGRGRRAAGGPRTRPRSRRRARTRRGPDSTWPPGARRRVAPPSSGAALRAARRARRGPGRRGRGRGPTAWAGCGRAGGPGAGSRTGGGRWITPALGSAMPPSTLRSDVLPAPLRPTSPTRSPARTVKAAPSTTRVPPTSTVRPRTDNMADHRGSRSAAFHTLSTVRHRWP